MHDYGKPGDDLDVDPATVATPELAAARVRHLQRSVRELEAMLRESRAETRRATTAYEYYRRAANAAAEALDQAEFALALYEKQASECPALDALLAKGSQA